MVGFSEKVNFTVDFIGQTITPFKWFTGKSNGIIFSDIHPLIALSYLIINLY